MSQLGRTEKRKARAPGKAEDPKAGPHDGRRPGEGAGDGRRLGAEPSRLQIRSASVPFVPSPPSR